MKRVPAQVKYNSRMTKRFFVRVPDQMWEAIQRLSERESERTGRLVEAGSIARELMQRALEEDGELPRTQPVRRRGAAAA
jgi:muconolactone delta-isomerase